MFGPCYFASKISKPRMYLQRGHSYLGDGFRPVFERGADHISPAAILRHFRYS